MNAMCLEPVDHVATRKGKFRYEVQYTRGSDTARLVVWMDKNLKADGVAIASPKNGALQCIVHMGEMRL